MRIIIKLTKECSLKEVVLERSLEHDDVVIHNQNEKINIEYFMFMKN